MKTLKIEHFGQSAQGIRLLGNTRNPEPDHVRIVFPGGEVEVVRATDGKSPDYWVHLNLNHPHRDGWNEDQTMATVCDARLDQTDKHASESNLGDFERPELYHVAIRVRPQWDANPQDNQRACFDHYNQSTKATP
jgi:hypothetical protein